MTNMSTDIRKGLYINSIFISVNNYMSFTFNYQTICFYILIVVVLYMKQHSVAINTILLFLVCCLVVARQQLAIS